MAKGTKQIIEGTNPEVVCDYGNDVVLIIHNAVPTDGASGTGAGVAGPGSLCINRTAGNIYINANTKASPTWKLVTRAA
ncbi:MAG: hypothetical protein ACOY4I_04725 [Bacillota bacterium]